MSSAPITSSSVIFATAIHTPLASVVDDWQGLPAWCWLAPRPGIAQALQQGTIPGYLIVQAQTPLAEDALINASEIAGQILLKAVARSDTAAHTLRDAAVAALAAGPLTPPSGYAVWLAWDQEIALPPMNDLFQATALYRVRVRRV